MMKRALALMVCASLTAVAAAQEPQGRAEWTMVDKMKQAGGRASLAVETRVTRGQPYRGEAVTEFVQVLADGNRIVRRSTARIYRDSEGRTRRETGDTPGSELKSIVITDPVGGFSLVLDPASHTATRAGATFARFRAVGTFAGAGGAMISVTNPDEAGDAEAARRRDVEKALVAVRAQAGGPGQDTTEDLGEQTIEGVAARGTRTTNVIPAGAIGNELPLTTISEQWFSTELGVLVMTRHSDPRVGETTYRLTNILRAEPDKSLFQMPPDYTLREPMLRKPQ